MAAAKDKRRKRLMGLAVMTVVDTSSLTTSEKVKVHVYKTSNTDVILGQTPSMRVSFDFRRRVSALGLPSQN